MELFNEYYNSRLQFCMDIFSLAAGKPVMSEQDIRAIAEAHSFGDPSGVAEVLAFLTEYGFIQTANGGYKTAADFKAFVPPLNRLEREYLADICGSAEAALFIGEPLRAALASSGGNGSLYGRILRQNTAGKKGEVRAFGHGVFRAILRAIYERRTVAHTYVTNADKNVIREAELAPYRLEYNVFDGRWWAIFYSADEHRTIKAKLENILEARPGRAHGITEETVENAIKRLLAKEPVELRINNVRNVLERCFILFEHSYGLTGESLGGSRYVMRFRYFTFDKNDIVKKLLYLGEHVVATAPEAIREGVAECLRGGGGLGGG